MIGPFHCIADLRGELMESPVWDERRATLFACDINGRKVYEIDLEKGPVCEWTFEAEVPCIGLAESGKLIVALAREVILFDPDKGEKQTIWNGYDEPETSRLNDGKIGPDGALWIGSMDCRPARQPIAKLYRITADGQAAIKAQGFEVSNGLAWTPDATTMFHTDSRGPWIDRYVFDPTTGHLGDRKRIRDLDEETGRPDGGACDAEGTYWSAGVSAGVLNRFSADGTLLSSYPVPVPSPTMPCFCGPDLKQIALTSHRLGSADKLTSAPQSGGVHLATIAVAGAKVARMKGI
ncbi:SMP-30/gluconolactonase/LRE family protein [Brucella haematophila]|uniref:SMP-30/gluconolactonase/LRE family protein n=1 Tax=Brucella haematophila TaxID=419474 RepID=A0ABX1DQM3_9HYPH|nr:SMP-30/gluconolactonase/LRE family protein [Brucella haematophila]NKC05247.1 SMP-30/gluconolactonase/LRE family protein [Brucella haematophila]TMV02527.1 SMP-30/gluconolactonase/LRE family protein [Brucella haematophila]